MLDIERRDRGNYRLRACLSSIQHKHLSSPTSLLPIHLKQTWSRLIQDLQSLILVSNQLTRKVTSGLHTMSGLSCWMNQRYARIRKFPFLEHSEVRSHAVTISLSSLLPGALELEIKGPKTSCFLRELNLRKRELFLRRPNM